MRMLMQSAVNERYEPKVQIAATCINVGSSQ